MFRKFTLIVLILSICTIRSICEAGVISSGSCGGNTSYILYDNGVLTISGSGNMDDYLIEDVNDAHYGWFNYTPWQNFNQNIVHVVVDEGVTSVGSHSFADCKNLKSVQFASTVNYIGSQAFKDCKSFVSANIPSGINRIGDNVFDGCDNLQSLPVSAANLSSPTKSKNIDSNEYSRWANPVKSYLYVEGENLVRFENANGQIVVEKYSPDFKLISAKRIESDMSYLWGGFFAGQNDNYIIVGRPNPSQSDTAEIIRAFQYDKNWNLKNQTALCKINTVLPFYDSSLRCAEYNGRLYIHTAHRMYMSSDGLQHQSNMSLTLRESDMKFTECRCDVSYINSGHVGHSFNQFILIDSDKNILTFDQGDAFPRSAIISKFNNKAGNDRFAGQTVDVELVKFNGNIGDSATGASIGGLAETANQYVATYIYDGVGGNPNDYKNVINKRDLFIAFISKKNFSQGAQITKISTNGNNFGIGTPAVVPVDMNGGYIIWNQTKWNDDNAFKPIGKIGYSHYNDAGVVTSAKVADGHLSDCQPIIYNGKITWYVTDNSVPIFYTLDESGVVQHNI